MSEPFVFPTPTPSPVSGVVTAAAPPALPISLPLPAHGQRRVLIGWSNILRDVHGEIVTTDPVAAAALYAKHTAAVEAVERLTPRPLVAPLGAMDAAEEAWVKNVASTPAFINAFGQRGWSFVRAPLDILVTWQPVIDSPLKPPPTSAQEVIERFVPEKEESIAYSSAITPDPQGGFHVTLTAANPNHDLDVRVNADASVTARLKGKSNIVHGVRIPNGRIVVLNGYNRLAQAASTGHTAVPLLLLEPGHPAGAVGDRAGFLPINLIVNHRRPPLIPDFFNPEIAIDVPRREVSRVHDLSVKHTEFLMPR